jgi:hypothetical protein
MESFPNVSVAQNMIADIIIAANGSSQETLTYVKNTLRDIRTRKGRSVPLEHARRLPDRGDRKTHNFLKLTDSEDSG